MSELHKYKVGIMSHVATIEGPSESAAALFYGLKTNGNALLMAVVYEVDGKPTNNAPLIEYQFGKEMPDDLLTKLIQELKYCKILEWGK